MARGIGGYSNKGASRMERRREERQARSGNWLRTHSGPAQDPEKKEEAESGQNVVGSVLSLLKNAVSSVGERSKLRAFTVAPFHIKARSTAKARREQKKTRHTQRRKG